MFRLALYTRRVPYALACALGLALAACGGGGDTTAPTQDPVPHPMPGPEPAPQPGPQPAPQPGPNPQPTPQPAPNPGIAGTYQLIQINNSQPGQLVTVANPDGSVVGLYRFANTTQLTVNGQGQFAVTFSYTDDKNQFALDDQGQVAEAGETGGSIALAFSSAIYGDSFQGIAVDGVIMFSYDFDGDGRTDTTFAFQRIA
ncbi:MAG TPA: hypothetical protein VJQ46_07070 [Gemmatimonadales bacterium]|nr:hypothetical protein [Gemmatimonadales bacterium]